MYYNKTRAKCLLTLECDVASEIVLAKAIPFSVLNQISTPITNELDYLNQHIGA